MFALTTLIQVILMSLKAGGEGLNLQEASHVFLLEPWWNPAVEMQAVHRAYRIGQKKVRAEKPPPHPSFKFRGQFNSNQS